MADFTEQNPRECVNVPAVAKDLVDCLQEYVRQSAWPIYDRIQHTGHWRLAMVRTTERGEGGRRVLHSNKIIGLHCNRR